MVGQSESSNGKHGKNNNQETDPTSTGNSRVSSSRRHGNRAAFKGNTMMLWTIRKLVALCVLVVRIAAFLGIISLFLV